MTRGIPRRAPQLSPTVGQHRPHKGPPTCTPATFMISGDVRHSRNPGFGGPGVPQRDPPRHALPTSLIFARCCARRCNFAPSWAPSVHGQAMFSVPDDPDELRSCPNGWFSRGASLRDPWRGRKNWPKSGGDRPKVGWNRPRASAQPALNCFRRHLYLRRTPGLVRLVPAQISPLGLQARVSRHSPRAGPPSVLDPKVCCETGSRCTYWFAGSRHGGLKI